MVGPNCQLKNLGIFVVFLPHRPALACGFSATEKNTLVDTRVIMLNAMDSYSDSAWAKQELFLLISGQGLFYKPAGIPLIIEYVVVTAEVRVFEYMHAPTDTAEADVYTVVTIAHLYMCYRDH